MDAEKLKKSRQQLPEVDEHFLDIEKIFRGKNERMADMIPGFIFRYLKRITHQDWLNAFIYSNRDKWGLDFVKAILDAFDVHPVIINEENIPREGKCLIASNHPLGGIDGVALMHVAGTKREDIVFPVNDLLMNVPGLQELFIPVNKHGSNAENVRIINDTFASDIEILYFPAGLVSRKQSGIICDLEWKKTFLTRCKRYKRNIVPVFISGRNSNFFYRLANLRKRFKIKANIEMLYLVDEMMKLKDKNFKIIFGKEIPWTTFDKRFSDKIWAEKLKEHVYSMESDPGREFEYGK